MMQSLLDRAQSRSFPPRLSTFTRVLSILIPRRNRDAFRHWYAYLRWVDDVVDHECRDSVVVAQFIERQFMLLRSEELHGDDALVAQEGHLVALAGRGPESWKVLRTLMSDMLQCIAFDARRSGQVQRHDVLHENHRREVSSYLSTIAHFCGLGHGSRLFGVEAAYGAKLVHIVRDLREDCAAGLVNVSVEEFAAYGLDVDGMDPLADLNAIVAWSAAQCRIASSLLEHGLKEISAARSIRYRVFVIASIAKYQSYLRAIRLHDFDPVRPVRLRVTVFATLLLRSLARSWSPRAIAHSRRERLPATIHLPTLSIAGVYLDLHGRNCREASRHLRRSMRHVIPLIEDPKRVARRFRVAYLLGRYSCAAIAPSVARDHRRLDGAGLLYAYWATSGIELDCLMDSGRIDTDEAVRLATQFLDLLRVSLFNGNDSLLSAVTFEHVPAFGRLTRAFMEQVAWHVKGEKDCAPKLVPGEATRRQFYESAVELMSGQLKSLVQMETVATRDWRWYHSEILNSKNVEFLLAPFRLWCSDEESERRFVEFRYRFALLNRTYLHYQLLDDVADQREDCEQGVVGAPGAVLTSQAAIGRYYLRTVDARSLNAGASARVVTGEEMAKQVTQSALLCPEFAMSPLFDRYRHLFSRVDRVEALDNHAEALVRCALANSESDMALPLTELAAQRSLQGSGYGVSMANRDVESAACWLSRSGVSQRFLAAVGEDSAVIALRDEVARHHDPATLRFLYTLERLMRHTYGSACSVAGGEYS